MTAADEPVVLWEGRIPSTENEEFTGRCRVERGGHILILKQRRAERINEVVTAEWCHVHSYSLLARTVDHLARELAQRKAAHELAEAEVVRLAAAQRERDEAVAALVEAARDVTVEAINGSENDGEACDECGRRLGDCSAICRMGKLRTALAHPALKVGK